MPFGVAQGHRGGTPPTGSFLFNRASPLAQGLLGDWKFDARRDLRDQVDHKLSPTWVNGEVWSPTSEGMAPAFDGAVTAIYLDFGAPALFKPSAVMTVQARIIPASVSQNMSIMGAWSTNTNWLLYLGQDAGNAGVSFAITTSAGGKAAVSSTTLLTANRLVDLVGVADGSNVSLYADGRLVGGPTAYNGTINTDSTRLVAGRLRTSDAAYAFSGQIRNLRVWNRGLTAAEVWRLYDPLTRWDLYAQPAPHLWAPLAAATGATFRREYGGSRIGERVA